MGAQINTIILSRCARPTCSPPKHRHISSFSIRNTYQFRNCHASTGWTFLDQSHHPSQINAVSAVNNLNEVAMFTGINAYTHILVQDFPAKYLVAVS